MEENKCGECGQVFDSKAHLMDHAKVHMAHKKNDARISRIMLSSIIGGIIGGIFMLIVLMAGAAGMGLPDTTFALIMGMSLGASMSTGVAVGLVGHFTVAIVAGAIFGAIVSYVRLLRMRSGPVSILLGLIFGIVVYLIFFLPMAETVFAPIMMKTMGTNAAMMLPNVLLVGFIGHIIYGITLGAVAYFLSRRL
jgi:hypothetical protein